MRKLTLIILLFLSYNAVNAAKGPDCQYSFDKNDASTFIAPCGLTISNASCKIESPATVISSGDVTICMTIKPTGNMEADDSAILTYTVDGVETPWVTLAGGDITATTEYCKDIIVAIGAVVSTAVTFTTDATQEKWDVKEMSMCPPAVLPIELISFSAVQNGNVVDLRWVTGSEINNDYFTVQRSADGDYFEDIAEVNGAGNSSTAINYFIADENPEIGEDYYRVMQTDYDGTITYSPLVSAYMNDGSEQTNSDGGNLNVTVFPNPLTGSKFYLSAKNQSEQKEILVVVKDLYGQASFSKIVVLEEFTNSVVAIDAQNNLKPGIYMITGSSNHQLFSKKLVVK